MSNFYRDDIAYFAETGNSMDVGGDSLFFLIEQKDLFINHHVFMIPYAKD